MNVNSTALFTCHSWISIQQSALFQLGNVCFFLAYASPNGKYGLLFLHSSLIAGNIFTNRCTINLKSYALYSCITVVFVVLHCVTRDLFSNRHMIFVSGYLLYSAWAWNVVCAPTLFAWILILVLLNTGQVLYITYQLQPAKFSKYLEYVYETLFLPIQVFAIMRG